MAPRRRMRRADGEEEDDDDAFASAPESVGSDEEAAAAKQRDPKPASEGGDEGSRQAGEAPDGATDEAADEATAAGSLKNTVQEFPIHSPQLTKAEDPESPPRPAGRSPQQRPSRDLPKGGKGEGGQDAKGDGKGADKAPWGTHYFLHDDRGGDDGKGRDQDGEEASEEDRGRKKRPTRADDDGPWPHDKFLELVNGAPPPRGGDRWGGDAWGSSRSGGYGGSKGGGRSRRADDWWGGDNSWGGGWGGGGGDGGGRYAVDDRYGGRGDGYGKGSWYGGGGGAAWKEEPSWGPPKGKGKGKAGGGGGKGGGWGNRDEWSSWGYGDRDYEY